MGVGDWLMATGEAKKHFAATRAEREHMGRVAAAIFHDLIRRPWAALHGHE